MAVVPAGQWTVEGSGSSLRLLSVRLRATGQSGLKKNMTTAVRAATVPARAAVRAELRSAMPKSGGLNEWLAKASITSTVLTGPKTAGVVIRGRRTGHDLAAVNRTGKVRHPTRSGPGFKYTNREIWRDTHVPSGWWERSLAPFAPAVRVALVESMNVTAREAGFI